VRSRFLQLGPARIGFMRQGRRQPVCYFANGDRSGGQIRLATEFREDQRQSSGTAEVLENTPPVEPRVDLELSADPGTGRAVVGT
jgi:hypothetical protein